MAVRRLARDEILTVAETLALAFDDDPIFRYMLPDDEQRAKWIRWFHRRAFGEAHANGGTFTLDKGGPSAGAIALFEPGTWPPKAMTTIRATPMIPSLPTSRLVLDGLRLEQKIHKLHPPAPHLYVYVLGVHPSLKGRGLGGTLLRHALSRAKEAGVVAYLETGKPENLSFYRRFGFEVTSEVRVRAAPPLWTMTTTTS